MRAHLHAGGPFGPREAEIALRGELDGLAGGAPLLGLDHDDVAPRTAARAVAAADARGLVDRDLERAHLTADGTGRAIHHADGIGALVARRGDQPVAILLALADELGGAVVGVGATAHA